MSVLIFLRLVSGLRPVAPNAPNGRLSAKRTFNLECFLERYEALGAQGADKAQLEQNFTDSLIEQDRSRRPQIAGDARIVWTMALGLGAAATLAWRLSVALVTRCSNSLVWCGMRGPERAGRCSFSSDGLVISGDISATYEGRRRFAPFCGGAT